MRCPACLLVAAACSLLLTVGLSAGAAQAQDPESKTEPATGDDTTQPAPAKAKKITGETLALEAAEVQNKHCADAYGRDTTRALQSIATVAEVWAAAGACQRPPVGTERSTIRQNENRLYCMSWGRDLDFGETVRIENRELLHRSRSDRRTRPGAQNSSNASIENSERRSQCR